MKAFVLCKLSPGNEQTVVSDIRSIEGVNEVFVVFGGWDLILSAEADTMDKLCSLIVGQVRAVKGVSETEPWSPPTFDPPRQPGLSHHPGLRGAGRPGLIGQGFPRG